MGVNSKLSYGMHGGRNIVLLDQSLVGLPEAHVDGYGTIVVAETDGAGNLPRVTDNGDGTFTPTVATVTGAPAAANILAGRVQNPGAATTLVTIPAGRTWVGQVGASVSCAEAAAGSAGPAATAIFSIAGANATPAAGTYLVVDARSGSNAATGTVGSGAANFGSANWTVVAPAGNSVQIQVASTIAGTSGIVDAFAFGTLY